MPSMLVTVKISKGFETWTKMAKKWKSLLGRKERRLFGLREDVKKAREEAGADVSSNTVITPIGDYWLG